MLRGEIFFSGPFAWCRGSSAGGDVALSRRMFDCRSHVCPVKNCVGSITKNVM